MAFPIRPELENAVSASESFLSAPVATKAGVSRPGGVWPGLVLVGVITGAGYSLREMPGLVIFSPMILAVIIGMLFANTVGVAASAKDGIRFSQKTLLRLAIVLLGFQLTVDQAASIGVGGFGLVALTLAATFLFTIGVARLLGVERRLAQLIAAGTSICGASAIVAANTVTNARDEDVAYAVASITLFGTVAMLAYPLLGAFAGLDQNAFGLWAGASIHEVAQVIGAAFQYGPQAGEAGTVAKLTRVALLAPMVFAMGFAARRGGGEAGARAPMPWFVLGFIAVVLWNSFVGIPDALRPHVAFITTLMLTMGLAAMGLNANVSEIRSRGLRPLLLALSAFVFIAVFSLVLVKFLV